jgi:hypothetical protein
MTVRIVMCMWPVEAAIPALVAIFREANLDTQKLAAEEMP